MEPCPRCGNPDTPLTRYGPCHVCVQAILEAPRFARDAHLVREVGREALQAALQETP